MDFAGAKESGAASGVILRLDATTHGVRAAALILIVLAAGLTLAPAGLFTVDEYFYVRAAEAMAEEGALTFRQFDVDGAPALDMNFARPVAVEGRLAPQYPSGYAVLAAPFFAAFGVKGLMLLSAIAAAASLLLTLRIARALGADRQTGALAVFVLAVCTYWSTYVYAIWPHMIALTLTLAVVDRALASREGEFRAIAAAGLIAGLAQSIRIDMIVLAPAIILWLRLFGAGDTRRRAAVFAASLTPGITFAAALNFLKLGEFNPFDYDNNVIANDERAFLPLAVAAGALLAFVLAVDVRRLFRRRRSCPAAWALALAGVGALCFAPAFAGLARGYWYALIDAQSYEFLDRQIGIVRDQWGWLSFYGFSKKALAQSAPFLPLAILPVVRFFRGELQAGEALLLILSAAFATLYSFNQTDSGLGLNARFLLPLLPAISILAAIEIRRLQSQSGVSPFALARQAFICALFLLVLRFAAAAPGALATPLDLYPQLLIGALLIAAVAVHEFAGGKRTGAMLATIAALALGAGAAISATDLIRDRSYRSYVEREGARLMSFIPDDALVVTTRPGFFAKGATSGLCVAYPGINDVERERAAISAFQRAGRCAYAHGKEARHWLDERIAPGADAGSHVGPKDAELAPIPGNPEHCSSV
jgi:hypothetical protein